MIVQSKWAFNLGEMSSELKITTRLKYAIVQSFVYFEHSAFLFWRKRFSGESQTKFLKLRLPPSGCHLEKTVTLILSLYLGKRESDENFVRSNLVGD